MWRQRTQNLSEAAFHLLVHGVCRSRCSEQEKEQQLQGGGAAKCPGTEQVLA